MGGSREPGEEPRATERPNSTKSPRQDRELWARRRSAGGRWQVWSRGFWLRSLSHEPPEAYFSEVLSALHQFEGGSRTGKRNRRASGVARRRVSAQGHESRRRAAGGQAHLWRCGAGEAIAS